MHSNLLVDRSLLLTVDIDYLLGVDHSCPVAAPWCPGKKSVALLCSGKHRKDVDILTKAMQSIGDPGDPDPSNSLQCIHCQKEIHYEEGGTTRSYEEHLRELNAHK